MKDLYKTRYKQPTPKIDYALAAVIASSLFLCILWLYAKAMQKHGLLPSTAHTCAVQSAQAREEPAK